MKVFVVALLAFMALTTSASGASSTPSATDSIQVWWSSELLPGSASWFTDPPDEEEIRFRLERQADLTPSPFRAEGDDEVTTILINPSTSYQEIIGIGTALEDTSVYAIRKGRTRGQIKEALRSLIDPDRGLGFNLFRVTIGTSDFSDARRISSHPKGFYTYQDREEDEFSIDNDIKLGIVDTLKLAQEVARELDPPQEIRFFASCWSPPPWMKTSGQLIGGTLKPGYEKALALYFRRFIEAYEELGIPIFAMTIQNEPNFSPPAYPGMKLTKEQELALAIAMWEEFHLDLGEKPEIKTRIWVNDHNFGYWENADFILSELEKTAKKHYVDATAFHNYDSDPAANMTRLHERHPDTGIVFTEHSEWGTAGMFNIQQYFWNWAQSYVYWVAATTRNLAEHNQSPYNRIGELSPTLLIEETPHRPGFYRTPEYYLLGQFSRFVRPGATRIYCTRGSVSDVTAVCFQNPDASIVAVIVNQTGQTQPFRLVYGERSIETELPEKCVGSYVWRRPSGTPK